VESQQLLSATFTRDGARVKATRWVVAQYLLGARTEVCMVGIICAVMGAIVAAFFVYHVALAAGGVTTNESFKWADLAEARAFYVRRYELEERVRRRVDANVAAARAAAGGGGGGGGDGGALAAALKEQAEVLAKIGPPGQPPPAPVPPNAYHKGALTNLWAMLAPPTPAKRAAAAAAAAPAAREKAA